MSDFWFENCNNDMGQVVASSDGMVIGVLCIARWDMDMPGAVGETQWGTNNSSDRRRKMYLFEWTGGQVTQTPDYIQLLQTNVGGANYGHWALSLSSDASQYFLKLKVSTHHGNHESAVSYYINRSDGYSRDSSISSPTSCGSGHTISNRIVYNSHNGVWSMYCGVDSGRAMRWVTTQGKRSELGRFDAGDAVTGPSDYPAGGVSNMISLGANGMLASATGPLDILPNSCSKDCIQLWLEGQKIGIRKLPLTNDEFDANPDAYPWRWINHCPPTRQSDHIRAGVIQLHNWGQGGESSGRQLLGYTPAMRFQGYAQRGEHHAVEINENGEFLHDPVILQYGGWGEDSLGVHMPGSGCVVFPHAWFGDASAPLSSAPSYNDMNDNMLARSPYIRLTALCPDDTVAKETPFSTCKGTQPTQGTSTAPARAEPAVTDSCPASSIPYPPPEYPQG